MDTHKGLALRFYGKRDLRLDQVEVSSQPKPDQVLVKTHLCGICTTDRDIYFEGSFVDRSPVTIGHESALEIVAIGSDVPGDKDFLPIEVGDLATAESIIGCQRCFYCSRGWTNVCRNARYPGVSSDGFDATYQIIEWHALHKALPGLTEEQIASVEPAAGALHAVKNAGVKLGDVVVVLGAGPIGLYMLQSANASGAEVVAVDPVASKRKLARELGAREVVDPNTQDPGRVVNEFTAGLGADVVMEAVGMRQTLQLAVSLVRKRGMICAMGLVNEKEVPIDFGSTKGITFKETKITGTVGHGLWPDSQSDFKLVMKLMLRGKIQSDPLITHRFGIHDWQKAFDVPVEQRVKILFNKFE